MLNELSYFTEGSSPYGLTYGEWTVKWWRWFLSIPKPLNPALEGTGQHANTNQPSRDVYFLVGKLADGDKMLPNRSCKIPPGRSVLFPVINCEANQLECPELSTMQDLVNHVSKDEDSIITINCIVNGVSVPPQRVRSDPLIFDLTLSGNNVFDIREGRTQASADGYWVFLKPLSPGNHAVFFEGSCEYGRLHSGAIYSLDID